MCGPQVRFCERLGGAIPRAYSTALGPIVKIGSVEVDVINPDGTFPRPKQSAACFGLGDVPSQRVIYSSTDLFRFHMTQGIAWRLRRCARPGLYDLAPLGNAVKHFESRNLGVLVPWLCLGTQ